MNIIYDLTYDLQHTSLTFHSRSVTITCIDQFIYIHNIRYTTSMITYLQKKILQIPNQQTQNYNK